MRRISFLVVCLLCLFSLSGCFIPNCVYPKLDHTPSVKFDAPANEVHAFRVDIRNLKADLDFIQGTSSVYERLAEVPVSKTNEVPSQTRPSVTSGFYMIGIALNYPIHTSHSVALRLYRPGYELCEIRSWEHVNRVTWKPATGLEAQEKALDALFPQKRLEPGSQSAKHREALLFGAAEYKRLAAAVRSREQAGRLNDRAKWLRALAQK
jgi:hypothetical protein